MNKRLAEQVLEALQGRQHQAAFVTEVAATIRPSAEKREIEAVLQELGRQGKVLVADYASPDPHLDAADLRVVACIVSEDAETEALEAAEAHWNTWMRAFIGTHRCQ